MKAKEVLKILYADGWFELKGTGTSHKQLKHPTKKGKVTLSFHGSNDIEKGTLNSIVNHPQLKLRACGGSRKLWLTSLSLN